MDVVTLGMAKAQTLKLADTRYGRQRGSLGVAVTDNCFGSADFTQQTQAGTSRLPKTVGVACGDIRLRYSNSYNTAGPSYNDADGAGPLTIRASVEVGGQIYRVTFGGRTELTLDPGGDILSDPLGLNLTAGQTIYTRTYVNGTYYANHRSLQSGGAGGFVATTDLTAPGSGAVADSASWMYGPSGIVGIAARGGAAVLIVGDSIANGYKDSESFTGRNTALPWLSGGGFISRALWGKAGSINIAISGDTGSAFSGVTSGTNTASFRRLASARYCTHAVVEYGRNDLSGGKTLAQIQSYIMAIVKATANRGLPTFVCTILPRTTSTDSWFTAGAQTVHSSESVRVAFNNWVRAGSPVNSSTLAAVAVGTGGALLAGQAGHPITGYFDAADYAESARDSGFWKPARIVTDAAMTSGGGTITSTQANWTNNDIGKTVIVRGAGAGGVDTYNLQITSVSGNVATMNGAAGTTVSGATAGIGVMTNDGIHPLTGGCIDIAPSIDLTKFK